jgi:hypothetical protein
MLWQESGAWGYWEEPQESAIQFSWFRNDQFISDQLDSLPLPVGQWGRSGVLRSQHDIIVPANLESGRYELRSALNTDVGAAGDAVVLAEIDVEAPVHNFELPEAASAPSEPAQLALAPAGRVSLAGYTLLPEDDALELNLYWQTDTPIPVNYTAFAQLISAENQLIAQSDSIPAGGDRPTAGWVIGEIIADPHILSLPIDVPLNTYRLIVGLYDPFTGQRLPLVDTNGSVVGDAITVDEVTLP